MLTRVSRAMNIEHNGSAHFQPKSCMSRDEKITPTEPNASAKTCRNIPKVRKICDRASMDLKAP